MLGSTREKGRLAGDRRSKTPPIPAKTKQTIQSKRYEKMSLNGRRRPLKLCEMFPIPVSAILTYECMVEKKKEIGSERGGRVKVI